MGNNACKNNRKEKIAQKTKEVIKAYTAPGLTKCDPNGSYTGNPKEKFEKPVQDVDDL